MLEIPGGVSDSALSKPLPLKLARSGVKTIVTQLLPPVSSNECNQLCAVVVLDSIGSRRTCLVEFGEGMSSGKRI